MSLRGRLLREGRITVFAVALPLAVSCGSELRRLDDIPNIQDFPQISAVDIDLYHSVDGVVKLNVKAHKANIYSFREEPETEFPEGIHVEFFDDQRNVTSYFTADRAIYHEKQAQWEGFGNIEAKNIEGTIFNTEYLIWDEASGEIRSDRFVKVTDTDGVITGTGFRARQDFTDWHIYKTTGMFKIDDSFTGSQGSQGRAAPLDDEESPFPAAFNAGTSAPADTALPTTPAFPPDLEFDSLPEFPSPAGDTLRRDSTPASAFAL